MPRYSSNGPRDAQIIDDADMGFDKLNMRMRADQLPVGTLARSENGRFDIDGSWQPRKAIDVFGPILASGNALQLPFYLKVSLHEAAALKHPAGSRRPFRF